jgi:hypothetical protein
MSNEWTDEQIIEWVTIITIFAFATYPSEMIYLGETSLGKLFAAAIVVYYTMVDPAYGILACCVIIVYYQLDLYKSYVSLHRDTLLRESMIEMQQSISPSGEDAAPSPSFESHARGNPNVYSYTPHDFTHNNVESLFSQGSNKMELLSFFRKENCDKRGRLMHNGAQVRPEMADHVFREVRFKSDSAKCNPCDPTCDFSIIEERMTKEEDLVRPVSGKDEPFDWNQFFGHYVVTPITSIRDDVVLVSAKCAKYF